MTLLCLNSTPEVAPTHGIDAVTPTTESSNKTPPQSILPAIAAIKATACEASPSQEQIRTFVQTTPLFAYVRNKSEATAKLEAVQQKASTSLKLQNLARLFNGGPMTLKDPLFEDPDFEELVVLACISGKITTTQLGTAFYWKSALNHYKDQEIHEVPLFLTGGPVNPVARAYMKQGIASTHGRFPDILNDEQLDHWFEEMRKCPASEQIFLHTRRRSAGAESLNRAQTLYDRALLVNSDYNTSPSTTITVMDIIYSSGQTNLFNQIELEKDGTHRVIPSMGMISTLFNGGSARMVVRFGMSKSMRENGLQGERDVGIRSSFAKTFNTADGYAAPYEEFTSHDFYHFYIANCTPRDAQKLTIDLADTLREHGEKDLADACEDMEHRRFRHSFDSDEKAAEFFVDSVRTFAAADLGREISDIMREVITKKGDPEQKEILLHDRIREKMAFIEEKKTKLMIALKETLEKKQSRSNFEDQVLAEIEWRMPDSSTEKATEMLEDNEEVAEA